MPQLQESLASICLSSEDLGAIVEMLNDRFGNQQQFLDKTIAETRAEYDDIKAQLKALTYERIEAVKKGRGISSEVFDSITEELTDKQQTLNAKLSSLTNANFGFLVTISHLLDLAQRANQLFQDADTTSKNKLLRFVHANSTLYDKKLSCRLDNTFEYMSLLNRKAPEGAKSTNWCAISYEVKTLLLRDLQKVPQI